MANKEERINKIHEYLHGRLKNDEKLEFEKELELDAELQIEFTYWKNIEIDYRKSLYSKSVSNAIQNQESNRNRYLKYAAIFVLLSCVASFYFTFQYFENKKEKEIASFIPKQIRLDTTSFFSKGLFESIVRDINSKNPKETKRKLLSFGLNKAIIDTINIDFEPIFGGSEGLISKDSTNYYSQLHLHLLAVNYYNMGDYSSALALFEMIHLKSLVADVLWYKSMCYYNLGKKELYKESLYVIAKDSSNIHRKNALKILKTY